MRLSPGQVTRIAAPGISKKPDWNPDPDNHPSRIDYLRVLEELDANESAMSRLKDYYARQSETWFDWVDGELGYFSAASLSMSIIGQIPPRVLEIATGSVPFGPRSQPDTCWVSTDINVEMLHNAGSQTVRVAADSFHLPFADDSFGLVLGVNAVCSPREAVRVLESGGILTLLYSFGQETPIYAPAGTVLRNCPLSWTSITLGGSFGEVHFFGDIDELSHLLPRCIPT